MGKKRIKVILDGVLPVAGLAGSLKFDGINVIPERTVVHDG